MRHFLLFYEAGPDYLDRRPQFRGEHLRHAWAAHERGELVVAGALAEPVDGAVLMSVVRLFLQDGRAVERGLQVIEKSKPDAVEVLPGVAFLEVAERFAQSDPYVNNGLVARWHVREWTTVVGDFAATPVRPEHI